MSGYSLGDKNTLTTTTGIAPLAKQRWPFWETIHFIQVSSFSLIFLDSKASKSGKIMPLFPFMLLDFDIYLTWTALIYSSKTLSWYTPSPALEDDAKKSYLCLCTCGSCDARISLTITNVKVRKETRRRITETARPTKATAYILKATFSSWAQPVTKKEPVSQRQLPHRNRSSKKLSIGKHLGF